MAKISIDISGMSENQIFWFHKALKYEMEEAIGASSNEELFAKGTDGEASEQHIQNMLENRAYAEMLLDAIHDIEEKVGWERSVL